jgi:RNA polymerase sigma factor FliA
MNMIRFAITDSMRQVDDNSRLARFQNRRFEEARLVLANITGHLPSDYEVEQFSSLQAPVPIVVTQSMDAKLGSSGSFGADENAGTLTLHQEIADYDRLSYSQLVSGFDSLVHFFDLESRTIFFLYYFKGVTMKEIGRLYGLSESRLSQLHSTLIGRLQRRYELLGAA